MSLANAMITNFPTLVSAVMEIVKKLAEKYDGILCEENYHDQLQDTLDKKEFPALTLRKTAIKTCVDEMLWIWQRKSNEVDTGFAHWKRQEPKRVPIKSFLLNWFFSFLIPFCDTKKEPLPLQR